MGKISDKEAEAANKMSELAAEASKIAMDAFTQGYLLGSKHAEHIFKEGN